MPDKIYLKASGIRRQYSGIRFAEATKEQAEHNNRFWRGAEKGSWFDEFVLGDE